MSHYWWHESLESCVNYRLKPTGQHSRREAFVNMIYLLLKQYITHHFSMVSSTSNLKDMELILIWIFLHGKVFTNEHQKLFRGRIPNKLHLSAANVKCVFTKNFTLKATYRQEERENFSATRPPRTCPAPLPITAWSSVKY